jgi:hypothetical protein
MTDNTPQSPCMGNGNLNQSPSPVSSHTPITPRGGLYFRDSSRLLFSMYSKIEEDKDNRVVERRRKDVDGILIFVSPRVRIHTPLKLERCRPVYSLPLLLRYFP